MLTLRPAQPSDQDAIWDIFRHVIAAGDTYVFDPQMPRDQAMAYWFQPGSRVYVAEIGSTIVGTYQLKPNQPGLGNHVANAAFMVCPTARGQGVGQIMGEHCLTEALRMGYRAMQFNFVVSTNAPAIGLWQKLGFKIVGRLPGAFRHPHKGYVDALVMYRLLTP